MPSYTLDKKIQKDSKLHKRLVKLLSSRIEFAERYHTTKWDKWVKAEEQTVAYMPEQSVDAVRRSRRSQGIPQYTTIQIPYTYAMLMSAHTYWTSVFFARSPVHQYQGLHGETEQQVLALEALISYQIDMGGAMGPYYIWPYDAGKYGLGIIGTYWDKEKIHYGQILELEGPDGNTSTVQATMELEGYEGNRVYNCSPFDWMHDPRVPVGRFQEGEFVCVRRRLGWTHILRRKDQGYFNSNIDHLKDHVTDKNATAGSSSVERPDFAQQVFTDLDQNDREVSHPAGAVFIEVYVDLVPKEWGLGETNFPQKWCFTITEDKTLIVGASPLGYMHNKFPFDVLETEIEAYGSYNRGFPETIEAVQNTIDWLINTHLYNVRAALNNQFILDPSKILVKDAKDAGPGFIWRLRPEAYGSDITKMFHQVPVNDVTRTHLGDVQNMLNFGEKVLGVNDQMMGSMNAGGRKTATEVRTSTGFGVNRLKTISEYMSATGMSTHSMKLVSSSQQYYKADKKFRLVGDLAQEAGMGFMQVTPEAIAGGYSFVPIDGNLPVDRAAQANLWKEIFMNLRHMPPSILGGYQWDRIFPWMSTLAGLRNIQRFRVQVVPDQALAQQAQAGNVIPMNRAAGTPGANVTTQMGQNALGPQPAAPGDVYGE